MIEQFARRIRASLATMEEPRRVLIFILILMVTLTVWSILLDHPLSRLREKKIQEIALLTQQIETRRADSVALNEKLKINRISETQTEQLLAQLRRLIPAMPTIGKLREQLTQSMMNPAGLQFSGLSIAPPVPWLPSGIHGIDLPPGADRIQQFRIEMHFKGSFEATYNYLTLLSRMPWHLYWQSLSYQVTNYPLADVTVVFLLAGTESVQT